MSISTPETEIVEHWLTDPVAFCSDILNVELWERQQEIAQAVANHDRIAVKSGHKIGKSRLAVALSIWWVFTHLQGRVILLTPSHDLIKNSLWKDLRHLFENARFPLGEPPNIDPRTGWRLSGGRSVVAVVPSKPESLQGLAGPSQLIIVDEAAGIDEHLFPAIYGSLAGGGKLLLTGNPTKTSGSFYEAFHSQRDRWATFTVASTETPNFHGSSIPGLATPDWVAERLLEYGSEDNPEYQARVLGEFPSQQSNALISVAAVQAAQSRAPALNSRSHVSGPLYVGVDVARFGDDSSTICVRRSNRVYKIFAHQGLDSIQLGQKVIEAIKPFSSPTEVATVRVDEGGVGSGVVDFLRRIANQNHLKVVPVNASNRAKDPNRFVRARDEAWWAIREFLADPTSELPNDQKLAAELVSPTYGLDARGRIQVESKDSLKKRLRRSPDRADALALSLYEPAVVTDGRLITVPFFDPLPV